MSGTPPAPGISSPFWNPTIPVWNPTCVWYPMTGTLPLFGTPSLVSNPTTVWYPIPCLGSHPHCFTTDTLMIHLGPSCPKCPHPPRSGPCCPIWSLATPYPLIWPLTAPILNSYSLRPSCHLTTPATAICHSCTLPSPPSLPSDPPCLTTPTPSGSLLYHPLPSGPPTPPFFSCPTNPTNCHLALLPPTIPSLPYHLALLVPLPFTIWFPAITLPVLTIPSLSGPPAPPPPHQI